MRLRKIISILALLFISLLVSAQGSINVDYSNPKEYTIVNIDISGVETLSKNTLISISELGLGEKIFIPGDKIKNAITKLWDQGLFADIAINIDTIIGDGVYLNIFLKEQIRLSKFKFEGKIRKSDVSNLKEDLKLMRGKVLTQNLINNSLNNIRTYFIEKGYLNVLVDYKTYNDSTLKNSAILVFNIKKSKKIKINNIKIIGRDKRLNLKKTIWNNKDSSFVISNYKLRKTFKETKQKKWWRFFKISKFIESNYTKDKQSLIKEYNNYGYRDARILHDTIYFNNDNTINIEITLEEGEKYKFGEIKWVGNTIYDDEQLSNILGVKNGDIFNQTILDARLLGNGEGGDVSSLYLDDGYLFFNATPLETNTKNNKIDFEIRVREGEQARINKVSVIGIQKQTIML